MTETFIPPIAPSFDSANTVKPRVLIAPFGDGYRQRVADGINNLDEETSLVWELLTQAQAEEIDTFFRNKAGYQSFFYRLPWETRTKVWTCPEWSLIPLGGGDYDSVLAAPTNISMSINASFRLEFDVTSEDALLFLGPESPYTLLLAPGSDTSLGLR